MASSEKLVRLVLSDCHEVLKNHLNEDIVDQLWRKDCINRTERINIKSRSNQIERNEILLDILNTK